MVFYLDSKENRRLKLIKLLYSNKGYTVSELAKELEISSKTVRMEIDELSEYLIKWDHKIRLIKIDSSWIIKKNMKFNLELIFSDIKRSSFQFAVVFAILLNSEKNYTSFLKKNYYSNGTGYKKIKEINNFLETYGISINTKDFTLVGEELTIRLFIYKMLKEVKFSKVIDEYPLIKKELKMSLDRLQLVTNTEYIGKEYDNLMIVLFIVRQREGYKYGQLLIYCEKEIGKIIVENSDKSKDDFYSISNIYSLLKTKNNDFKYLENESKMIRAFIHELELFFQVPYFSEKIQNGLNFIFLCYLTINPKIAYLLLDSICYHKPPTFMTAFYSFYDKFFNQTIMDSFYLKKSLGVYINNNIPAYTFYPEINVAILVESKQIVIEKLQVDLNLLGFNLVFFEEDEEIVDLVITDYYDQKEAVIYLNHYPTDQEINGISRILREIELEKQSKNGNLFVKS